MIKTRKMEKETKKRENLTGTSPVKYRVHDGVFIPEMNKQYTIEALENDAEACAYLVEIGSKAVTEY